MRHYISIVGILLANMLVTLINCAVAQEWEKRTLFESNGYFFNASSELSDNGKGEWINRRYGAINLFDGDFTTHWAEGANGCGIGETILVSLPINFSTITLANGYSKSPSDYKKNNRVRSFKLSFWVGINPEGHISDIAYLYKAKKYPQDFTFEIKDNQEAQTIASPIEISNLNDFKEQVKSEYLNQFKEHIYQIHTFAQIEIISVYPGSRNDDTYLGEIFFNDTFVPDYRKKTNSIESVYVDKSNPSRLLANTDKGAGVEIINKPQSVLQLTELSGNRVWAIVTAKPKGDSSSESEQYVLINTALGTEMNSLLEQTSGIKFQGRMHLEEKQRSTFLVLPQGSIWLR